MSLLRWLVVVVIVVVVVDVVADVVVVVMPERGQRQLGHGKSQSTFKIVARRVLPSSRALRPRWIPINDCTGIEGC